MRVLVILFLCLVRYGYAQPADPFQENISVVNDQGLSFGRFWQANDVGGSVSVSNTGVRTSTAGVGLVASTFFYSIFTITTQSTSALMITIDQPNAILYGSNGGSMSLQIGPSNPLSPSVVSGSPTQVFIGGTLSVGSRASNPPGNYTGEVLITFTVNNE
jgi:hypothetical protein